MSLHSKEEIQLAFDKARYCEELYYAVKSNIGEIILTEIRSQSNDLQVLRRTLGSQQLEAPDYKMSDIDVRKLEILSAQISAIESVVNSLNVDILKDQFKQYQEEAEQMKQGLSLEPVYTEEVDPISN